MGQAKRRGTFEERKESAILRDQEIERKRKVVESFREKDLRVPKVALPLLIGGLGALGYYDYIPLKRRG